MMKAEIGEMTGAAAVSTRTLKLLVIGAAGQVGQEFSRLAARGLAEMIPAEHAAADVRDMDALTALLAESPADAVINLAAFHNTELCESDRDAAFGVNALGARNVALAAAVAGKKVVFFSSDYVFGGRPPADPAGYGEDDRPDPLNVYGMSKAAGELLVRAAAENHLIIRTSSLFGTSVSRKGWTFPEMVRRKLAAGEHMRVVSDQVMAPTYTKDLAARTLELLEAGATGTFNVAGGGRCSWYDLAVASAELAGLPADIEPVSAGAFPAKARRPSFSVLRSPRMEAGGFAPMRHWRKALEAYFEEKGEME